MLDWLEMGVVMVLEGGNRETGLPSLLSASSATECLIG